MPLFEDPFSNYRGPGVIGLFLGVVVLVAFAFLAKLFIDPIIHPGPGPEQQLVDNAARIDEKEQELRMLTEMVDRYRERKGAHEELARLRSEITAAVKSATTQEAEAAQLIDEIAAIKENCWAHIAAVRKAAKDEEIRGSLSLRDGKTYEGVTIKEVTRDEMRFSHRGGGRSIPLELLPQDLQDRFQPNPEEPATVVPPPVPPNPLLPLQRKLKQLEKAIGHKNQEIADKRKEIADDENRIAHNRKNIGKYEADSREERRLHKEALGKGNISAHLAVAQRLEREAAELKAMNNKLQERVEKSRARIRALETEIRDCERGELAETKEAIEAAKNRPGQEDEE